MPSEFGEESKQEIKEAVKAPGVNSYTWEELSKLNERHNLHVAVRGKVYDVSSFVDHHPGGLDQILFGGGRDITTLFESYHPFSAYNHFAITHKPWVWRLTGSVHVFFHGEHVLGHHSYTNIDGHDPDIITAAPELLDFRRIKHNQCWIAYYFYQHIYCPLLYCLTSFAWYDLFST